MATRTFSMARVWRWQWVAARPCSASAMRVRDSWTTYSPVHVMNRDTNKPQSSRWATTSGTSSGLVTWRVSNWHDSALWTVRYAPTTHGHYRANDSDESRAPDCAAAA